MDSIYGQEIQKIADIISNKAFITGKGAVISADAVTPYKEFIRQNIKIPKPIKVGLDAGNGTAGVIAVPLLKSLSCMGWYLSQS